METFLISLGVLLFTMSGCLLAMTVYAIIADINGGGE